MTGPGAEHGAPGVARASACFLERVPLDFARRHAVASRGMHDGVEEAWVAPGTGAEVLHNLGVRLGRPVRPFTADAAFVRARIDEAYAEHARAMLGRLGSARDAHAPDAAADGTGGDLLSEAGKGRIARLLDTLLAAAVVRGASDIHFEPGPAGVQVRYRVDGALVPAILLARTLVPELMSRMKVLTRLDPTECRAPQDGRASIRLGSDGAGGAAKAIDVRVGTVPTRHGERVVLRLLDRADRAPPALEALGMRAEVRSSYEACASSPQGLVLVAGPTGSGKTTTLYATVRWILSRRAVSVVTIEDPVEYDIAGTGLHIGQCQVSPRRGLTFATGLRHLLRQDPDVILVGEVRDTEAARLTLQASLTGHLVLTSIHAGDAAGAVARLTDLGVEPLLLADALACSLSQRLLRRTHVACRGTGCGACGSSGFQGRTAVFELLRADDRLRDLIVARASRAALRGACVGGPAGTLRGAALALADAGVTTPEEVGRVLGGEP